MTEGQLTNEQARDLDETRRLLYCALAASRTKHYELAGTIANALVHHQGYGRQTSVEVLTDAIVAVNGGSHGTAWAWERIHEITEGLGHAAAEAHVLEGQRSRGHKCGVCGHDLVQVDDTFGHAVPGFAGQTYSAGHSVDPIPKGIKVTLTGIPAEVVTAIAVLDEVLEVFRIPAMPRSMGMRSLHVRSEKVAEWRRQLTAALDALDRVR